MFKINLVLIALLLMSTLCAQEEVQQANQEITTEEAVVETANETEANESSNEAEASKDQIESDAENNSEEVAQEKSEEAENKVKEKQEENEEKPEEKPEEKSEEQPQSQQTISSYDHTIEQVSRFHFHIGNHTQFIGQYQTDDAGDTEKLAYNPVIGVGANFHVWKKLWVAPEVILGLPRHDRDEHTKRTMYFFRVDALIPFKMIHLRLGSSYIISRISSNGGTQTLKNGDSTQDFFLPPIATASRNYTWDIGLDYMVYKNLKIRLQTFIYTPVTPLTRTVSYTFGIGYQFDKIPFLKK